MYATYKRLYQSREALHDCKHLGRYVGDAHYLHYMCTPETIKAAAHDPDKRVKVAGNITITSLVINAINLYVMQYFHLRIGCLQGPISTNCMALKRNYLYAVTINCLSFNVVALNSRR